MKIAVATIAKNEDQFVCTWADSGYEADYRFILDTGSTDETLIMAATYGVEHATQVFTPWRFDHARNAVWDHIPDDIDYVIWLDMDEVLTPGWRQALEAVPAGVTRPRYKYVWSWNPDGSEGLVYGGDKICARHGYTWRHPVHEVLTPLGEETQHWVTELEIHHHPDPTKSRGQYFDLLKLAVEEDPNDDRNQFYLGREYFYQGLKNEAAVHLLIHLELSRWRPERAASCRYLAECQPERQEHWLWRAVAEDSDRRENWVALAEFFYLRQDWVAVRSACEMAFRIDVKPLDYLCEPRAWGWLPHDLMALACNKLGDNDQAWFHGAQALALRPDDERLRLNMNWYRQ